MSETVKEQLVDMLREDGYDFVTACEHVTARLAELPPGDTTLHVGNYTVTVHKS